MKAVLMSLIMMTVVLAGCADSGGPKENEIVEGKIGEGQREDALSAGKGAIEGLLVDDAFRPLELTDTPQSTYQFSGFLFIQELALQIQTNENGEFTILDVEPGNYRLRPQVDRHDGGTQRITVTAGEFTEVTVQLQRKASSSSTILTEEYTGFTPCGVGSDLAGSVVFTCLDTSNESYRPGPGGLDYTAIGNITYVVIEMRTNNEGGYYFAARPGGTSSSGWAQGYTEGGNYAKAIMYNSNLVTAEEALPGAVPWPNEANWEIVLFYNDNAAHFATKSQFMVSVFINEPTLDLDSYALIADDQAT
jgi:hypothetical protein